MDTHPAIREIIEGALTPGNDYIYGFADLKGLLGKEYDEFPSGISIGQRLDDSIIDGIDKGPTREYYDLYNNTNTMLAALSLKIQKGLTGACCKRESLERADVQGRIL